MSPCIVVVPTYNECENIERMIRALLAHSLRVDVLVVDDASPDGTGAIVQRLGREFPERVFLETRSGVRGLGRAYVHGFKWSLRRDYRYIFEMDADFSHAPEDLSRLHQACEAGADVAIGSRYVPGGAVRNWSWPRLALSRGASIYARAILGWRIRDATAGFICFRRKVLAAIDLEQVRFVGYAFQIEMKYVALRRGFALVEIPIVFVDRVAGESKMSFQIFNEAILGVWKIKSAAGKICHAQ